MNQDSVWPELPIETWEPTRDTLTLWLQIVGRSPSPARPCSTTGGTRRSTSPPEGSPHPSCRETRTEASLDLDLIDHRLHVTTTRGQSHDELAPKSVSDFYRSSTKHSTPWR